ncbi:MAG: hypothetical protein U5K53_01510 [Halanaerobiales bacterium]|nr:hypothetical protein [Halanaerobiales bacterium]
MKYQPKLQFEDKYNIKDKTIEKLRELIKNVEIDRDLIDSLYADSRKTTSKLAFECEKKYNEEVIKKEKVQDYKNIENQIYNKGFDYIYGFFVTGLYAAAGPLTFCLVRLNRFSEIKDIRYSNKHTENNRKKLYNEISKDIEYIDTLDLSSSIVDKKGLKSCIIEGYNKLKENLDQYLDDDNENNYFIYYKYGLEHKNKKIIKNTNKKVYLLAAASIITKVDREEKMKKLHEKYPEYYFNQNFGYITDKHKKSVREHGFSKVHRKSFNFEKKLELNF